MCMATICLLWPIRRILFISVNLGYRKHFPYVPLHRTGRERVYGICQNKMVVRRNNWKELGSYIGKRNTCNKNITWFLPTISDLQSSYHLSITTLDHHLLMKVIRYGLDLLFKAKLIYWMQSKDLNGTICSTFTCFQHHISERIFKCT